MPIYKTFLKLASQSKYMILIFTLVFIGFTALSTALSHKAKTAEEDLAPFKYTLLGDEESLRSEAILALESYLGQNGGEKLELYPDESIDDALFYVHTDVIITVADRFLERLIAGEEVFELKSLELNRDADRTQIMLQNFATFLRAKLADKTSWHAEDSRELVEILSAKAPARQLLKVKRDVFNAQDYLSLMAYGLTFLLFNIIGYALAELEMPLIKVRIALSQRRELTRQFELFLAELTICLIAIALYLSLGFVYFAPGLLRLLPIASASLLVLALVISAMAHLLIALFPKVTIVPPVATTISLALAFISGIFIPVDLLNEKVLFVAKLFPLYYYAQNIRQAHEGWRSQWVNLLVMILFAVIYFLLALLTKRWRLSQDKALVREGKTVT